jgi:hypothetical protein
MIEDKEIIESLKRVDLEGGGLFIFQMEEKIPMATIKTLAKRLTDLLSRHSEKEVEVLLLPVGIKPVGVLTAEDMNKLGWFKESK